MLFTTGDTRTIKQNIKLYHTLFIAQHVGVEALTPADRRFLTVKGYPPGRFKGSTDYLTYAFYFGDIESSLRDSRVLKELTFENYKKFVASGAGGIKLGRESKKLIKELKVRAAADIKKLAADMQDEFADIMADASKTQRLYIERMLRKKFKGADITPYLKERMLTQLTKVTQKYLRRFEAITAYAMHAAYTYGTASSLIERHGANVQVYFRVHIDACPVCKRVYLKYIDGPSRVFYLKAVIRHGSNRGKKGSAIKASLDPLHPRSLTDGRTMVLTKEGYKQIRHIKEGEFVLTHKGRFKKVESVLKNYIVPPNYPIKDKYTFHYQVNTKHRKNQLQTITVTAEHKIFTQRGWVQAQDVQKTDKLIKILQPCRNNKCKNYVDFVFDGQTCCGDKCVRALRSTNAAEQWKNGTMSNEVLAKIADTVSNNHLLGLHVNSLAAITDAKMREFHRKRLLKDNTAIRMQRKAGLNPVSKQQLKLYNKVKILYPSASLEYEILGKSLDIALTKQKINIEFDGHYWHKNRKEYDQKRDDLLAAHGWHTLRYSRIPSLQQLRKDIFILKNNSCDKYKFVEIKIHKIVKSNLKVGAQLFDLQVADDESFIAKGVVIHNCRCKMCLYPGHDSRWDKGSRTYVRVFK